MRISQNALQPLQPVVNLPVRVVHAGHDPSFGRDRLLELIDAYLAKRDT